MADSLLKSQLQEQMKLAMKAQDKPRLGTIRLMLAALKQVEVDDRRTLTDQDVLSILDKMVKQRRDAKEQYEQAQRPELAEQEAYEIKIISEFLPKPLTDEELKTIVTETISEANASSAKDMGKVMGLIKPKVQGRADMRQVSAMIKQALS